MKIAEDRCPYVAPLIGGQCVKKRGHRLTCKTAYSDGTTRSWYGINFPKVPIEPM